MECLIFFLSFGALPTGNIKFKTASLFFMNPRRYYEKSPHTSLTVKSRGLIVGK
jgi:hypothetical protein